MGKGTKIMLIIWAVLAIANFCLGWALPLGFAIPIITFGVLNLSIVASLVVAAFQKKPNIDSHV